MEIQKIEVLLRAIELGSFSKAAEEYMYTPSALSHIVNSVESEIGTRIIKRTYTGVEIDDGKKEIIEKLEKIVELKNQIIEIATSEKRRKTITIGTYASLSKCILPKVIKGFKMLYPDIDINIIVDDKINAILKSGNADILFGEIADNKDVIWEEVITDPYVAVIPKSYGFTGKAINREKLYNNTFIMAEDGKISNYMSEKKIDDIIKINSHDDSSVIQLVKEGMGVSILPALSVENNEDVTSVELVPELVRVLGLMYKKSDFNEKEYMRKFIEYFRTMNLSDK